MQMTRLENMTNGWFVGNFSPASYQTQAAEVAVKHYSAGEREDAHFHKIATEVTLILSGHVRMFGRHWTSGDILVLTPGEITDFEALTDATTVVVKMPSVPNDKYHVVDK